ncbi:MAG: archaeosine biosynthesis radical SAM protein RaSEA [Candidatus Thorarchaeota archaeon]|jgi:radical SAM enzyme (TIGR01210 family)
MEESLKRIHEAVQQATVRARGQSVKKRRKRNLTRPSAKWTAPARVGRDKGTALAIVLSTIGCAHARSDSGGCTMCSYLLDGSQQMPSSEQLIEQFKSAMTDLEEKKAPLSVKIYTSGSFLDPDEIPEDARSEILKIISDDERIREVVLESRPEYVQDPVLSDVRSILGDRTIEIGMGLESANDTIRTVCINKSFDLQTFKESLETAKGHNIGMRAYILLKPPLLTERDSLLDAIDTVRDARSMGVTTVSLNPVNVQKDTLVEKLWNRRNYRPPWLWSVLEVLREASATSDGWMKVICDPVAGGKRRGAHNCGKCDSEIVQLIREFSLNQDPTLLEKPSCGCLQQWKHVLKHEDSSQLIHR